MFDLSKSVSQLYLAILRYRENIYFSSTHKNGSITQKNQKKKLKIFPPFMSCKIKLDIFYEEISFLNILFCQFFYGNNVDAIY